MQIITKQISDLIPADYNPRKDLKPSDKEYKKLKKSITEFGYIEPIVWNQQSGRVIGGHQRLKILQELGMEEIETVVVDLPEDKEKALNLALNKISGDWDMPKLKDLLEELDTGDFDIEITGFDEIEIESLMTAYIDHDKNADKSGASPWSRMDGDAIDGILFSFGEITARINRDVYDQFVNAAPEANIKDWIERVLLCANIYS